MESGAVSRFRRFAVEPVSRFAPTGINRGYGVSALPLYRKAQHLWTAQKGFRCPYLAIVIADLEGKGVNLSASDCAYLCGDDAISTVAGNHLFEVMPDA